eukprot:6113838-Ditylum_brightwellii.AAC.1
MEFWVLFASSIELIPMIILKKRDIRLRWERVTHTKASNKWHTIKIRDERLKDMLLQKENILLQQGNALLQIAKFKTTIAEMKREQEKTLSGMGMEG